jgi:hypothetical protein
MRGLYERRVKSDKGQLISRQLSAIQEKQWWIAETAGFPAVSAGVGNRKNASRNQTSIVT